MFNGRLQRFNLDELKDFKGASYERSPNTDLYYKKGISDFTQLDKDHIAILIGGY